MQFAKPTIVITKVDMVNAYRFEFYPPNSDVVKALLWDSTKIGGKKRITKLIGTMSSNRWL